MMLDANWTDARKSVLLSLPAALFLRGMPLNNPPAGRKTQVVLETPVSREAIRRALNNRLSLHHSDYWCIHSKEDTEFVDCMEDIIDVYECTYDEGNPVVCIQKKPYQLLGVVRESQLACSCDDRKINFECVRNGTCSILAFIEP